MIRMKPRQPSEDPQVFTPRGRTILNLVAEGYKNKEGANEFYMSEKDVSEDQVHLMKKLNVPNGSSVIAYAFAMRIALSILMVLIWAGSLLAESLVMIGWDGAGSRNVIPLLEQGKLPGLQSILDAGGVYVDIETVSKTVTVPTWTVIFTGLTSDQTGVSTNRDTRKSISIENIITRQLRDRGYKVGWLVSKDFLWSRSPLKAIMSNVDIGVLSNPETSKGGCLDDYILSINNGAIQFIMDNRGKNFFLFIHLNPDCYGHRDGENSERYLQEFLRSDELVQNVLATIDVETKVIVLNDHGFDEGMKEHNSAPDLWMVTNLPLKEIYLNGLTRGTTRDIPFTILDYFKIYDWRDNPSKNRGKSMLLIE